MFSKTIDAAPCDTDWLPLLLPQGRLPPSRHRSSAQSSQPSEQAQAPAPDLRHSRAAARAGADDARPAGGAAVRGDGVGRRRQDQHAGGRRHDGGAGAAAAADRHRRRLSLHVAHRRHDLGRAGYERRAAAGSRPGAGRLHGAAAGDDRQRPAALRGRPGRDRRPARPARQSRRDGHAVQPDELHGEEGAGSAGQDGARRADRRSVGAHHARRHQPRHRPA